MPLSRLIPHLRAEFRLDWQGIHGVPHWARVRRNGLFLAESTGANVVIVELFAFLHDVCRHNDGHDPEHGMRAAEFARSLNGEVFSLPSGEMDCLVEACKGHSHGTHSDDLTVQTCWDADRLDLGRVGIRPDPARLLSTPARDPDTIAWAYGKSLIGRGW